MDRIAEKIADKYLPGDFDKYNRVIKRYIRIKKVVNFLPRLVINTYLVWRFPFLRFKFSDKNRIFHTASWYWSIEDGWRKAFGIQLCKELKAELKRAGQLRDYTITDVKEKFGALTIYDEGASSEVHSIIDKYAYISFRTCVRCGRPAKYVTRGYILPFCEDCLAKEDYRGEPDRFYTENMPWYGWVNLSEWKKQEENGRNRQQ